MRAWQALAIVFLSLTASIARAETVDVSGDYGGFLVAYEAKWAKLAAAHAKVRISGPCVLACTIVAGFLPREDICVTPKGSLGFHQAIPFFDYPDLVERLSAGHSELDHGERRPDIIVALAAGSGDLSLLQAMPGQLAAGDFSWRRAKSTSRSRS